MRLSAALLIIATIGGLGWYGYQEWYPKLQPVLGVPAQPRLPVERTLTDRTGRTVDVRIMARDQLNIRFVRKSDGTTYTYPISSLADADQQFVRQFPASVLQPLPAAAGTASSAPGTNAAGRLQQERAELDYRIQSMRLELQKKNDQSPALPRDELKRRIDECRNRMIQIDRELLELSFRASGN